MRYSVGIIGMATNFSLDRDLVALVEHSGGGHFNLTDDADLESTFTRVAEELRGQYLYIEATYGIHGAAIDGLDGHRGAIGAAAAHGHR